MPNDLGLVHVVEMGGDTRAFPINGGGLTAREVLADFFNDDDVEAIVSSKSVNLVNRGAIRADNLDRPLEHNDTITIYSQAVANGGVKGAGR